MSLDDEEMSYRARALAQTHPLAPAGRRYINAIVEEQRRSQPFPEIALWASAGLIQGYCLRRIEEDEAGRTPQSIPADSLPADGMSAAVDLVVEQLRSGDPAPHLLLDEQLIFLGLNRLIDSELRRRLEAGEDAEEATKQQLAEFITWCVLHGYASRVVETAGAVVA